MPTLTEVAAKRVSKFNNRVQGIIIKNNLVNTGTLAATTRATIKTVSANSIEVLVVRPEYSLIQQHYSYNRGKIKGSDSKIKANPKAYRRIGAAIKGLEAGLGNDVADYFSDLFLTTKLIT